MAKEPSVRTSITLWSVARVRTDQRFETTSANTRATNGESTQIVKSTSRIRESLRRPAWSIKPSEPAAPASTAIRAAARRRPRNPPSGLPRLTSEVILPRPLMLIDLSRSLTLTVSCRRPIAPTLLFRALAVAATFYSTTTVSLILLPARLFGPFFHLKVLHVGAPFVPFTFCGRRRLRSWPEIMMRRVYWDNFRIARHSPAEVSRCPPDRYASLRFPRNIHATGWTVTCCCVKLLTRTEALCETIHNRARQIPPA